MSDFLNRHTVLVLNSMFWPIGILTPKKALITLNSSFDGISIAAKAIDVVYKKNKDGSFNTNELDYWVPLTFEEWLLIEPRKNIDETIHTAKLSLRSPSVIVTSYAKIPMRRFRPTKNKLMEMQNNRCGYTNELLTNSSASLEHKTPRSFGGKDTFENLMVVKKEINHRRGNRPLEEVGLKPLFSHREPKPIPASHTIKKIMHPDWYWFLLK